jgi:hypothetical protein
MRAKQLLEKLNDLATYLTLAANDAEGEQYKESRLCATGGSLAAFAEGRKVAYNNAFVKVGKIIKEAKHG